MNDQLLEEWVNKAEEDYEAALDLMRRRKKAVPDVICFLCQQCAEKYLKAFLHVHQLDPPQIHNLDRLNDMCCSVDGEFALIADLLTHLNVYAVRFRYPGTEATVDQAKAAVKVMKEAREFLRLKL